MPNNMFFLNMFKLLTNHTQSAVACVIIPKNGAMVSDKFRPMNNNLSRLLVKFKC